MTDERFPFDPEKLRGLMDQSFRAPDIEGTVEGWRAWGVPESTTAFDTPKLFSVTYTRYFWAPRQKMQAECRRCGKDVPGENCHCGFYSAKSLAHLLGMTYHQYDAEANGMYHVIGQVANWGKVIEGSQGWRSQFSYPVSLYVPYEAHRLADRLGQAYGVPVRLKNILVQTRREAI